jgi:hypothetical protein
MFVLIKHNPEEGDILKKAAACFVKESLWGT